MKLLTMAHQYLVGGYMYYILNESMMEDYEYDSICRELYKRYDELEYKYKHLIDKDNLKGSTAYTLREEDYPEFIKRSAEYIICRKREEKVIWKKQVKIW